MVAKVNIRERAEIFTRHGATAQEGGPVARWLRALRVERGIASQTKAAETVGVAPSSWAGWETGSNLPGRAAMDKITKWAGPEAMAALEQMLDAAPAPAAVKPDKPAKPARAPRGASADDLMVAIIGSALGEREKAALCAAVVAMNAGIEVRVELLV